MDILFFAFKTYHKLQGSQTRIIFWQFNIWFKTYHKLQGSQTTGKSYDSHIPFKTYHKLQGSQTTQARQINPE